jgi:atypical dual specificity phosphatase
MLPGFSWVDKPHLAAMSMPDTPDDLIWLRRSGVDVLISLSEDPPPRKWINDAGLMNVHVPVPDMTPPTQQQIDMCIDTIRKAKNSGMGVTIHCLAGKGRTGTMLAAYFVANGTSATSAIAKVRELRPGSIETPEQEQVIEEYAAHIRKLLR